MEHKARLALEHRLRPAGRLRAVCLQHVDPRRAGGLPGLLLRLAADGHGRLRVVGPRGTVQRVAGLQHLLRWRHPRVEVAEAGPGPGPAYADEQLELSPLLATEDGDNDDDDNDDSEAGGAGEGGGWARLSDKLPVFAREGEVGAASAEGKRKTQALPGLPVVLCRLRALESAVVFVDCSAHSDSPRDATAVEVREVAESHPVLQGVRAGTVACVAVFHLTEAAVAATPAYRDLVASLAGEGRRQFELWKTTDVSGFQASQRTAVKLRGLSARVFPGPPTETADGAGGTGAAVGAVVDLSAAEAAAAAPDEEDGAGRDAAKASSSTELEELRALVEEVAGRPRFRGLERRMGEVPGSDHAPAGAPAPSNRSAAAALRDRLGGRQREKAKDARAEASGSGRAETAEWMDGTEVVFLGTGCAEPSKHRASSGILLRLPNGTSALLDAGEGTAGQMRKFFGPAAFQKEVDALAFVWISHKHADHAAGVPGLLRARGAAPSAPGRPAPPPLRVVAPWPVHNWLRDSGFLEPAWTRGRWAFTHNSRLARTGEVDGFGLPCRDRGAGAGGLHARTELTQIASIKVKHCYDAYGLAVAHRSGWKLVYSGDLRAPCPDLVRAGRGCTLLIHEATFEDKLLQHAERKQHSTVSEAVRSAADMGAYRTVLTHFSQRYPGLPPGLPRGGPLGAEPIVAFDGMRLPLRLLPGAPLLTREVGAFLEELRQAKARRGEGGAPEDNPV